MWAGLPFRALRGIHVCACRVQLAKRETQEKNFPFQIRPKMQMCGRLCGGHNELCVLDHQAHPSASLPHPAGVTHDRPLSQNGKF